MFINKRTKNILGLLTKKYIYFLISRKWNMKNAFFFGTVEVPLVEIHSQYAVVVLF